ncbi:MAG: hypothetical protein HFE62_03625 [Firmicutes bacterium]|nr:hypothetical protein [Bacillota bacterium]
MKQKGFSKLIAAILVFCVLLSGCGCKHEYDNGSVTKEPTCVETGVKTFTCSLCGEAYDEEIPLAKHEYASEITLEPTYDEKGVLTYTCSACGDSYTEDIPVKERTVVVTVTNKTNIPSDIERGTFSDRSEFEILVENTTDENVRGVSGVLTISDLFGEEIMKIRCDLTGQMMPAGGTVTFSGIGVDINEFMSEDQKLYNESFSDLKFDYSVNKIVYENSDLNSFTGVEVSENAPAVITVTDKVSVPANFYNGTYSPRVNFTFNVENKTEKDIKGIQGTLTVFDLFGDEIMKIQNDFTGKTVPANSAVVFDNLGIEINQFMPEHKDLYNEDFADLYFSYKTSSIVYEDGSSENF